MPVSSGNLLPPCGHPLALEMGSQYTNDHAVELQAAQAFKFVNRVSRCFGGSEWPVRGHVYKGVRYRDDACAEGNLLTLKRVRITQSVESFVVVPDVVTQAFAFGDRVKYLRSNGRVHLHKTEFFVIQRSRFRQQSFRDRDLA